MIHKLILPHREKSKEITNKSNETSKKMEPGSCLELAAGCGEHFDDGRSCVRIQSFQRKDLVTCLGDITEKEKIEVQVMADCYASTTVNLATTMAFFSRMCNLESLKMQESEHHLVTAFSVEPGLECCSWSRSISGDGKSVWRQRWGFP